MNPFEFATAARIVFGAGKLSEIASIAPEFGTRALIVIGGSVERARSLIAMLEAASVSYETLQVTQRAGSRPRPEPARIWRARLNATW